MLIPYVFSTNNLQKSIIPGNRLYFLQNNWPYWTSGVIRCDCDTWTSSYFRILTDLGWVGLKSGADPLRLPLFDPYVSVCWGGLWGQAPWLGCLLQTEALHFTMWDPTPKYRKFSSAGYTRMLLLKFWKIVIHLSAKMVVLVVLFLWYILSLFLIRHIVMSRSI